jgi:tRNA dimethylallyltransferase
LKHVLNLKPRTELVAWLRHLDPDAARQVTEETSRQRIARLLQVVLLTGRPLGWWQQHAQPAEPPIDALTFVLELDRTRLYQRINERVQAMIRAGLVQEVEQLLAAGYNEHAPGMKTTGYMELIPYVRGQITLQQAIDAIQRATRGYARRQITWFRHQLAEPVVRIDAGQERRVIVDAIVQHWETHAHRN